MPNPFELQHAALGLNPNLADHNGNALSLPLTGVSGYTNLEVYLHELADALVSDTGTLIFGNGYE